jgi:hypothetical protein
LNVVLKRTNHNHEQKGILWVLAEIAPLSASIVLITLADHSQLAAKVHAGNG